LLKKGGNVLAIQGLNAGAYSPDFLIDAPIVAGIDYDTTVKFEGVKEIVARAFETAVSPGSDPSDEILVRDESITNVTEFFHIAMKSE
jgi:hypothetical protein